jgi:hypothetical protein
MRFYSLADNAFMNRRVLLSAAVIISGLLVSSLVWALVQTGTPAPRFNVSDGNDMMLNYDMLRGKVIVGFYEDRDQIEKTNSSRQFSKNIILITLR